MKETTIVLMTTEPTGDLKTVLENLRVVDFPKGKPTHVSVILPTEHENQSLLTSIRDEDKKLVAFGDQWIDNFTKYRLKKGKNSKLGEGWFFEIRRAGVPITLELNPSIYIPLT